MLKTKTVRYCDKCRADGFYTKLLRDYESWYCLSHGTVDYGNLKYTTRIQADNKVADYLVARHRRKNIG